MFLTVENLLHHLLSRGIISAGSVVEGDYRVQASSRRNRNYRVFRNAGPSLFIKQVPAVIMETTLGIYREAEWYRLARHDESFRGLRKYLPELLDYHHGNHTIITEFFSGSESFNDFYTRTAQYSERLAELQGQALGECHALTAAGLEKLRRNTAFPKIRPWIFTILKNPEAVMPSMGAATQQLVNGLRAAPDFVEAVSALSGAWKEACLMHGDVKWDNFLRLERDGGESIKVIDWELCDIGDPAWDVACVLVAYSQPWLWTLASAQPGPSGYADTHAAGMIPAQAALQRFWQTYRSCAGLPQHQAEELLTRAVCFAGVRLLVTAFEILNGATQVSATVGPVLQVAREIFKDPAKARVLLFGFPAAEPLAPPGSGAVESVDARAAESSTTPRVQNPEPHGAAEFEAILSKALEGVTVVSSDSFRVGYSEPVQVATAVATPPANGGQAAGAWPPNALQPARGIGNGRGEAPNGRMAMREALWPHIYNRVYVQGLESEVENHESAPSAVSAEFVARLSAANATANLWDPQWEVYQVDVDGAVHVRKRDIHRRAVPGEFSNVGAPGRPVVVGARVALLVQKESLQLQPGFYFAFGSAIGSEFDNAHLSRIYFNVPANHADTLLRLLSAECNRYEIPFSFKCLSDPAGYAAQRADSAVLYVAKRYLQPVLRILTRHAPELEMLLRAKSPMFSKPLFPGVGLADEPGTGESFGQSRSRLVADGLIDAWEHGQHDGVQKLEAVRERFRRQGLDLRRPHLNPGNFDCYQNPKLHESAK